MRRFFMNVFTVHKHILNQPTITFMNEREKYFPKENKKRRTHKKTHRKWKRVEKTGIGNRHNEQTNRLIFRIICTLIHLHAVGIVTVNKQHPDRSISLNLLALNESLAKKRDSKWTIEHTNQRFKLYDFFMVSFNSSCYYCKFSRASKRELFFYAGSLS